MQLTGETLFVFAKSGLNLRQSPSSSAAVVTTAPYGAGLQVVKDDTAPVAMTFEGLSGRWVRVQYDEKTGYAFSGLTGTRPAPKEGESYQDYIYRVYGPVQEEIIHMSRETVNMDDQKGWKEDFILKNGAKHLASGYYAGSFDEFHLPDTSMEEAFLAAKLAGLGNIKELASFPQKNYSVDKEDPMESFSVTVDKSGNTVNKFMLTSEYMEAGIERTNNGVRVFNGGGT